MSKIPDQRDYIRYSLYSAGIAYTEEDVKQIQASGSPHQVVDAWVALHQTCPAIKAMQEMKPAIESNRKEIYGYH